MAFLIRVNTSAIKSVLDIYLCSSNFDCFNFKPAVYQLAFFTPGINPCQASSLKQIRQSLNLRKNPPDLPQIGQRLYPRVENLGVFFHRFICEVFAIVIPSL
jgi:hypothetical protein